MKCEYCENEIPQKETTCPYCGAAINSTQQSFQELKKTATLLSEDLTEKLKENERKKEQIEHQHDVEKKISSINKNNTDFSPRDRIIFILLGIILGPIGIQFLYIGRIYLFAIVFLSFLLVPIFKHDLLNWLYVLIYLSSIITTFIIKTDGDQRPMPWLKIKLK